MEGEPEDELEFDSGTGLMRVMAMEAVGRVLGLYSEAARLEAASPSPSGQLLADLHAARLRCVEQLRLVKEADLDEAQRILVRHADLYRELCHIG